ncbi:MAG: hypothetical protein KA248_09800 [Kiritimatiellae bacterium]|nr:hypothetical protein [Kiritimatiellia bacterium]
MKGAIALLLMGLAVPLFAVPPPIYVHIVMHNEEGGDYHVNPALFLRERSNLVVFADMLSSHGVMFNWQSDWSFLRAVTNFDHGTPETDGTNVVVWLKNKGFEVDPHAHESDAGQHSYADVASLMGQCGVTPSDIAGGFIAWPPTSSLLTHLSGTVTGWQYTAETWTPAVLWGGGTASHRDETNLWVSGIWRPKDTNYFTRHDDAAPVPHIGNFGGKTWRWLNLDRLVELRGRGLLATNRLYTCAIFAGQSELLPAFITEFETNLLLRMTNSDLVWAGLNETFQAWQTAYGSEPNIFPFDGRLDSDADSLPDGWEASNFWDMIASDGTNDCDGDTFSDLDEFITGTLPADTSSYFKAAIHSATGAPCVISWTSRTGNSYFLTSTTNLMAGRWLTNHLAAGIDGAQVYTDTPPVGSVIYRVRVTRP